jgi:putative alpha-1,2-mannosidase
MYIFAPLIGLFVAAARAQSTDLTQYVLTNVSNGLIRNVQCQLTSGQTGEADGGNTFAGVALPFGMVKIGPDMFFGSDSYSGDATIGNFTGFSMMHESGTGGAPKYGVVSQMPVLGEITNPLDSLNDTRAVPDVTSIGYYKSSLGSNITVELSATSRAGFYQYTFPPGNQSNVVIDVSHVLPSYRGQGLSQNYVGGNITTSSNHYEGYGDYNNGWNRAPNWRIYFCACPLLSSPPFHTLGD